MVDIDNISGVVARRTPEEQAFYKLWYNVKNRCYNPQHNSYVSYGAKGVKMCDEWLSNRRTFWEWCISNGWEHGLALSRKGDTGDYSPDNCRFLSVRDNNRERARTKLNPSRVIDILNMIWVDGIDRNVIADKYNVTSSVISGIKHAKTWRDIVIPWYYDGNADL